MQNRKVGEIFSMYTNPIDYISWMYVYLTYITHISCHWHSHHGFWSFFEKSTKKLYSIPPETWSLFIDAHSLACFFKLSHWKKNAIFSWCALLILLQNPKFLHVFCFTVAFCILEKKQFTLTGWYLVAQEIFLVLTKTKSDFVLLKMIHLFSYFLW